MADLTETQAALETKIVGQDESGVETTAVGATSAGRLLVDAAIQEKYLRVILITLKEIAHELSCIRHELEIITESEDQ